MGYHTESRCQHQPACFSSTFKLRGTARFVEVGVGARGGGSSPIWDKKLIVMKEVTISPHSLLLLLYHFTSLQGILTFFIINNNNNK